jgi:hypothetical protein
MLIPIRQVPPYERHLLFCTDLALHTRNRRHAPSPLEPPRRDPARGPRCIEVSKMDRTTLLRKEQQT